MIGLASSPSLTVLVLIVDFCRRFASFIVSEPTVFRSTGVLFLADIAKRFHTGFRRGFYIFYQTLRYPTLGSADRVDEIQLLLR